MNGKVVQGLALKFEVKQKILYSTLTLLLLLGIFENKGNTIPTKSIYNSKQLEHILEKPSLLTKHRELVLWLSGALLFGLNLAAFYSLASLAKAVKGQEQLIDMLAAENRKQTKSISTSKEFYS